MAFSPHFVIIMTFNILFAFLQIPYINQAVYV